MLRVVLSPLLTRHSRISPTLWRRRSLPLFAGAGRSLVSVYSCGANGENSMPEREPPLHIRGVFHCQHNPEQTARQVAERFGVSLRTAYRWKALAKRLPR